MFTGSDCEAGSSPISENAKLSDAQINARKYMYTNNPHHNLVSRDDPSWETLREIACDHSRRWIKDLQACLAW